MVYLFGQILSKRSEQNLEKAKELEVEEDDIEMVFRIFPNPQRTLSTMAKTDTRSIQERPCFLCEKNRPAEQTSLPFGHYEICLNPYPIFQRHLTIIDKEHTSQSIKGRFEDMLHLAENMIDFYILYNGPECGASAPDHMHFQAAGKEESLSTPFFKDFLNDIIEQTDFDDVPAIVNSYANNTFITSIGLASILRSELIEKFENIYNILSTFYGKEPLINIIAWYAIDSTKHGEDDEVVAWNCVIFLRSKHRPDCYYNQGEKGLLISPAVAEMGGVFPIIREEDMDKLNTKEIIDIYKEISLSPEQFETLCDELFRKDEV